MAVDYYQVEDFFQEASLRFYKALDSYRLDMGARVVSYCGQAMYRALDIQETQRFPGCRMPVHMIHKFKDPEVVRVLRTVYLSCRVETNSRNLLLADVIPAPEDKASLEQLEVGDFLDQVQHLLFPRDWEVLVDRLNGYTLQEVSQKHRLTRERVRQLEKRALRVLRNSVENRNLQEGPPQSIKESCPSTSREATTQRRRKRLRDTGI